MAESINFQTNRGGSTVSLSQQQANDVYALAQSALEKGRTGVSSYGNDRNVAKAASFLVSEARRRGAIALKERVLRPTATEVTLGQSLPPLERYKSLKKIKLNDSNIRGSYLFPSKDFTNVSQVSALKRGMLPQRFLQDLALSRSGLRTKQDRGKIGAADKLGLLVVTALQRAILSGISTAQLPRTLNKIINNPKLLIDATKEFPKSAERFGNLARISPSEAIGVVSGELIFLKGSGKAISLIEKTGTAGLSKLIANKIKTTPFGVKKIVNVKGIGDIEIIPVGKAPKLDIDISQALKEANIGNQLKNVPSLPKTSKIEKEILEVVKESGESISGSFAAETILKKRYTRPHKDLDILVKNRDAFLKSLKKKLKDRITFRKKKKSVQVFYKGKQVADIVKIGIGEEGFAKKFGGIRVRGIKIVKPEARFASKVKQLGLGKGTKKGGKVIKDIKKLSGKNIELDIAPVKGAFGFKKKDLKKYIGKTGPLTTSQVNLLGKGIFKPSKINLKRYLYATPFNLKTGGAMVRVSRLGISKNSEAGLLDLLGYGKKVSFKRQKPQIFVFPREKIFSSKVPSKKSFVKTPKGFSLPLFSSELEVLLGSGYAVKRGKVLSRVNIDGKIVPIIEVKKTRLSSNAKKLINSRKNILKEIKSGGKKKSAKTKLANKLKIETKKLTNTLKKETGFDYGKSISSKKKNVRYIKPSKLVANPLILSIKTAGKKKFNSSPRIIIKRSEINIKSGYGPRPKSGRLSKISKSKSPSKSVKSPIKNLRGVKKVVTISKFKKRGSLKRRAANLKVFHVEAKSKNRYLRINRTPLKKTDALSRGAYAIDNSTARTFRIVPAGNAKRYGKIKKKERGYYAKNNKKLRTYRIKKGKLKRLSDKYIEKRKFAIDTRGEKKQLSLRRLIKKEKYGESLKRK